MNTATTPADNLEILRTALSNIDYCDASLPLSEVQGVFRTYIVTKHTGHHTDVPLNLDSLPEGVLKDAVNALLTPETEAELQAPVEQQVQTQTQIDSVADEDSLDEEGEIEDTPQVETQPETEVETQPETEVENQPEQDAEVEVQSEIEQPEQVETELEAQPETDVEDQSEQDEQDGLQQVQDEEPPEDGTGFNVE